MIKTENENKANKKQYKYNYIQFTVSDEEKKEIEEYTEKSGMKTTSEFVRQCIFDKIQRIKNPELFTVEKVNPAMLEEIMQNTKKSLELQALQLERTEIVKEMQKTLEVMKNISLTQTFEEEEKTITDLLKAHRSLSLDQIIDLSGIKEEIAWKIVPKICKMTESGRFTLK